MKIGCHALQWGFAIDKKSRYTQDGTVRKTTFQQVLNDIATLGFEGFECTDDEIRVYLRDVTDFRETVEKSGLEFVSTWSTVFPRKLPRSHRNTIHLDLPMSDPRQYEPASIKRIEKGAVTGELKRQIRYAKLVSRMGGRMLTVGGPYMMQENIRDEYYRIVAELLNDMGDEIGKFGMRIAYHPEVGTIVKQSEEVDRLFDFADEKVVHLCLETGHLVAMGEDPVAFVNKYKSRIIYVHIKDLAKGQFSELGRGSVDLKGVYRALKGVGYDGWLMAEVDVPTGSPFESAEMNMMYLESLVGRKTQAK